MADRNKKNRKKKIKIWTLRFFLSLCILVKQGSDLFNRFSTTICMHRRLTHHLTKTNFPMTKSISSNSSPLPPPHTIIIDWDETLTTKDTIQYLAQLPYTINSHNRQHSPPRLPFSHYTDIYMTNYTNYKSHHFGKDYTILDDYIQFQMGMEPIEMSSINALESDGVFQGLTKLQIRNQADLVQLRPGAVAFLERCLLLRKSVVILSVNWTSLMIDEVLRRNGIAVSDGENIKNNDTMEEDGKRDGDGDEDEDGENGVKIVTNEFEFASDGKTTGFWLSYPKIHTSLDKLNYINQVKIQANSSNNANGERHGDANGDGIMYIGDSLTDLLPILNVSFPCAIKDSKLDSVLTQLSINHVSGTWFDFIKLID